jgi:sugar phosphate isomerase/epimerase
MKTIKGPALLLGQFAADTPPHNTLPNIARWAAGYGYKGIQIPGWDTRLIDLAKCAESQVYADETKGICAEAGLVITEIATHLQGQLVAVHPAYDLLMDGLCPPAVRGNPAARQEWAVRQVKYGAEAHRRLGLPSNPTFSGALAWPYVYPFPQRPEGLVEEAFAELARRWRPILDHFEENGVDCCFEIHPQEDLFDGATWEMFLDALGGHKRANINYDASHFIKQGLDYLAFIDLYHDRIKAMHVKDAEFTPSGRQGFYSGYQPWLKRAARDRSLGDGQVNFRALFSKLAEYDFPGWAVYEWECCLKHPEDAAREGAPFIAERLIHVTDKAFDDFAGTGADQAMNRRMLGVPR